MDNQGYSNEGARQCCEIIWNGGIRDVTEVHSWTNLPGKYWPQGPDVKPVAAPVPETLDWQVWLAGAEDRPYSPAYAPHHWRGYPDFGAGAIGDMACHILGTPNMGLRLTAPVSVECIKQEGKAEYTFAKKNEIQKLGDSDINGSLFMGSKGMVTTGCYGERTRLIPDETMKDYKIAPKLLTRSPGHYQDWIRAAKGGEHSCSNFDIAGPFVQWMLLGVIAMKYEGKLEWDAQQSRFTNNKDANQHLAPKFRKGWKFVG